MYYYSFIFTVRSPYELLTNFNKELNLFYCETEETVPSSGPDGVFCVVSTCVSDLFFKASRAKKRDLTTCFSTFFFQTFFLIFFFDFEVRFC